MGSNDLEWSEFRAYLQEKEEVFEKLVKERHEVGREEYGEFSFLENDVIRMMVEELCDVVNYARMHAVKLLVLHDQTSGHLEGSDLPNIGFQAFKGTKDVGWEK